MSSMKTDRLGHTLRQAALSIFAFALILAVAGCGGGYGSPSGGSPAPSIASLNPASGAVGAPVTITGTNFGATQGYSTVAFNGTAATPTSWSATSIVVPVPTGAMTGSVVVTVGGVASNGMAFTVPPSTSPSITSLNPTSGVVGISVTIAGTNFGASQGASTVKFNTTVGAPTSWTSTSIVVPVPSGATTGNVVVTVGGVPSNGMAFTLTTAAPPNITSLNPTSGPVGTSVSIAGTNFGATQGTSTVKFGTALAAPTNWTSTSIVVPVPAGATTGNVIVAVAGVASNGVAFTVTIAGAPSITGLNPITGPVATSVTITGTNFGATQGTSTVTFSGTATTPTSWSATSIVAPVPTGATTGNVVVTVGGVPSNGVLFTVSTGTVTFPIKASANNRYFVDQNGTPWLMVADAAHHLMSSLPQSSLATYLSDRRTNGLNAIDFYGSNPSSSTSNGAAQDGTLPFTVGSAMASYDLCGTFTAPNSCTSPNPTYWAEVDNVINTAATDGIVALINPLPWGNGFSGAFTNGINSANNGAKIFDFGLWLGNRYKNFPNIIWYVGQDFEANSPPSAAHLLLIAQLMAGIKTSDPNHLIAAQLNYFVSYSQQADSTTLANPPGQIYQPNLSASFLYSYNEQYGVAASAYGNANTLPQYLGESNYETANNTHNLNDTKYGKGKQAANAYVTRLEMWWTMTSGGAGHEFGNEHVSHFDNTSPTWQSQLDTTATLQVNHLTSLFNQLQWWTMVPDSTHQVVTSGFGTSNTGNENLYNSTYATTAWNPNGSLAVVYAPIATTLTVDMTKFSKAMMSVSWYDPTTGNSTPIGFFQNTGSQNFTTPAGTHSDGTGTNDWVLVLQ